MPQKTILDCGTVIKEVRGLVRVAAVVWIKVAKSEAISGMLLCGVVCKHAMCPGILEHEQVVAILDTWLAFVL